MLAAVAFSVALGFGIVAPVIPVFAKQFGVGATAAGAVISAFAFMRLVFGPAGGWLVNKFGERLILGGRHRHRRRVQPAHRAGPELRADAAAARHRRRRAR